MRKNYSLVILILSAFLITIFSGCGSRPSTPGTNYGNGKNKKSQLKFTLKPINIDDYENKVRSVGRLPEETKNIMFRVYSAALNYPLVQTFQVPQLSTASVPTITTTSIQIYDVPIGDNTIAVLAVSEFDRETWSREVLLGGLGYANVNFNEYTNVYISMITPIQCGESFDDNFDENGKATVSLTPFLPEYTVAEFANNGSYGSISARSIANGGETTVTTGICEYRTIDYYTNNVIAVLLSIDSTVYSTASKYLPYVGMVFSDIIKFYDEAGIYEFGTTPSGNFDYLKQIQDFTSDKQLIRKAFESGKISASNKNPLYEAIQEIIPELYASYGEKSIIVVSTGKIESRELGEEVISEAISKRIKIYALGIDDGNSLKNLAKQTGGQFIEMSDSSHILRNSAGLANSIVQGYVSIPLTFYPVPSPGSSFDLSIKLKYDGLITGEIPVKVTIPE